MADRNAVVAPTASSNPAAPRAETAWGPVQGYVASRSAAATKTDTPIMETPQSISVVTRQQMVDRDTQTVNDAMRYTAGVQTDLYGPDARLDWYSIRGFNQSTSGFYLDGLGLPRVESPDSSWSIEPYALERVDILKGPSSVLFGQNYPGGLVSLVSKKPTEDPLKSRSNMAASTGSRFSSTSAVRPTTIEPCSTASPESRATATAMSSTCRTIASISSRR